MLEALRRDHISNSAFFYLDVSIEETLRRHQTRPLRMDVSAEQMREWYQHLDLLPGKYETVIPEHSPLNLFHQAKRRSRSQYGRGRCGGPGM